MKKDFLCKSCKKPFLRKPGGNNKQFCSVGCRVDFYRPKQKENKDKYWQSHTGQYSDLKCQCLICGRWYVQVGSHITQKHNMTAREYREWFDLEVKKGILPDWFRKIKGDETLLNGTWENLKAGKKFQFKKNNKTLGKYHRSPITLEKLKNARQSRINRINRINKLPIDNKLLKV